MIETSYLSSATRAMFQEDLEDILKTARGNNARLGITGRLLYGNNTFMQILEGEETVVNELVKPIDRHEYADWSMVLKRVSGEEFKAVKGMANFTEKDFTAAFLGYQTSLVDP